MNNSRGVVGTLGLVAMGVIAVAAIYQLNKGGSTGVTASATSVSNNTITNLFK